MRPLRELGPVIDTTGDIPARELSALHMDPPGPAPGIGDGYMLNELSPEAVDAIVESAGAESGSSLLSLEVRHLGGALARTAEGDGAASLDKPFVMFAVGSRRRRPRLNGHLTTSSGCRSRSHRGTPAATTRTGGRRARPARGSSPRRRTPAYARSRPRWTRTT